jgi:hypothetical protein
MGTEWKQGSWDTGDNLLEMAIFRNGISDWLDTVTQEDARQWQILTRDQVDARFRTWFSVVRQRQSQNMKMGRQNARATGEEVELVYNEFRRRFPPHTAAEAPSGHVSDTEPSTRRKAAKEAWRGKVAKERATVGHDRTDYPQHMPRQLAREMGVARFAALAMDVGTRSKTAVAEIVGNEGEFMKFVDHHSQTESGWGDRAGRPWPVDVSSAVVLLVLINTRWTGCHWPAGPPAWATEYAGELDEEMLLISRNVGVEVGKGMRNVSAWMGASAESFLSFIGVDPQARMCVLHEHKALAYWLREFAVIRDLRTGSSTRREYYNPGELEVVARFLRAKVGGSAEEWRQAAVRATGAGIEDLMKAPTSDPFGKRTADVQDFINQGDGTFGRWFVQAVKADDENFSDKALRPGWLAAQIAGKWQREYMVGLTESGRRGFIMWEPQGTFDVSEMIAALESCYDGHIREAQATQIGVDRAGRTFTVRQAGEAVPLGLPQTRPAPAEDPPQVPCDPGPEETKKFFAALFLNGRLPYVAAQVNARSHNGKLKEWEPQAWVEFWNKMVGETPVNREQGGTNLRVWPKQWQARVARNFLVQHVSEWNARQPAREQRGLIVLEWVQGKAGRPFSYDVDRNRRVWYVDIGLCGAGFPVRTIVGEGLRAGLLQDNGPREPLVFDRVQFIHDTFLVFGNQNAAKSLYDVCSENVDRWNDALAGAASLKGEVDVEDMIHGVWQRLGDQGLNRLIPIKEPARQRPEPPQAAEVLSRFEHEAMMARQAVEEIPGPARDEFLRWVIRLGERVMEERIMDAAWLLRNWRKFGKQYNDKQRAEAGGPEVMEWIWANRPGILQERFLERAWELCGQRAPRAELTQEAPVERRQPLSLEQLQALWHRSGLMNEHAELGEALAKYELLPGPRTWVQASREAQVNWLADFQLDNEDENGKLMQGIDLRVCDEWSWNEGASVADRREGVWPCMLQAWKIKADRGWTEEPASTIWTAKANAETMLHTPAQRMQRGRFADAWDAAADIFAQTVGVQSGYGEGWRWFEVENQLASFARTFCAGRALEMPEPFVTENDAELVAPVRFLPAVMAIAVARGKPSAEQGGPPGKTTVPYIPEVELDAVMTADDGPAAARERRMENDFQTQQLQKRRDPVARATDRGEEEDEERDQEEEEEGADSEEEGERAHVGEGLDAARTQEDIRATERVVEQPPRENARGDFRGAKRPRDVKRHRGVQRRKRPRPLALSEAETRAAEVAQAHVVQVAENLNAHAREALLQPPVGPGERDARRLEYIMTSLVATLQPGDQLRGKRALEEFQLQAVTAGEESKHALSTFLQHWPGNKPGVQQSMRFIEMCKRIAPGDVDRSSVSRACKRARKWREANPEKYTDWQDRERGRDAVERARVLVGCPDADVPISQSLLPLLNWVPDPRATALATAKRYNVGDYERCRQYADWAVDQSQRRRHDAMREGEPARRLLVVWLAAEQKPATEVEWREREEALCAVHSQIGALTSPVYPGAGAIMIRFDGKNMAFEDTRMILGALPWRGPLPTQNECDWDSIVILAVGGEPKPGSDMSLWLACPHKVLDLGEAGRAAVVAGTIAQLMLD